MRNDLFLWRQILKKVDQYINGNAAKSCYTNIFTTRFSRSDLISSGTELLKFKMGYVVADAHIISGNNNLSSRTFLFVILTPGVLLHLYWCMVYIFTGGTLETSIIHKPLSWTKAVVYIKNLTVIKITQYNIVFKSFQGFKLRYVVYKYNEIVLHSI